MGFVVIGAAGAVFGIAPSLVCAQDISATCPNFGLERTTTYDLQDVAYAYGYAVAIDGANNTYVTGEQYAPATGLDMYVIKYDLNGNMVWSDIYDAGGNESGYGITVDASGANIYVIGRQQDNISLNSDAFVRKYDAGGTLAWTQVYNSGGANIDIARGAALDGSGNVYAAGYRETAGGGIEAMLLSYDTNGTLRGGFPVAYSAPYNASASAFSVAVSGNDVYITGYTQPTANNTDMFVRKYTTGGSFIWTQTYDSVSTVTMPQSTLITPPGSGTTPWVYCPSGSTMLSATDTGSGNDHGINTAVNGCQGWEGGGNNGGPQCTIVCSSYTATVPNNNTDIGYGVTVNGSGNILVAGYQDTSGGDAFTKEYSVAGTLVSSDVYNSGGNQSDVGRSVLAGNSGRVFLIGRQQTNGNDAFLRQHSGVSVAGQSMCANRFIGFIYETQGTLARVYVSSVDDTGTRWGYGCGGAGPDDPGYWYSNSGKVLFYEFDWSDFPADSTFVATMNNPSFSYTFTKNTPNNTRYINKNPTSDCTGSGYIGGVRDGCMDDGGRSTNSDGLEVYCFNGVAKWCLSGEQCPWKWEINDPSPNASCSNSGMGGGDKMAYNVTCDQWTNSSGMTYGEYHCDASNQKYGKSAGMRTIGGMTIDWSYLYLHKGDQAGASEYDEMAFGAVRTPSSVPAYASTDDDIYEVGYEAANGGEMFLNKYSCNAAQQVAFGATLIANFTATPTSGPDPLMVNVDARGSAGSIAKYEWDWNYDGNMFSPSADKDALASHEYTAPGTYTIALRVTTSSNATDIATGVISVSANIAPIAAFTVCDVNNGNCVPPAPAPFTGVAPLRVNVDAAASTDPNALEGGYVKSFSWDWGDGTVAGAGEKATHLYSAPGLYAITLTVTDNGGLTNTVIATQNVSVIDQYMCAPACSGATPVCGSAEVAGVTQCYECLADNSCGAGYQCLGTPCSEGDLCYNGAACPIDGKCPEATTCNPLATGVLCPDGSACPADGICPGAKNICTLSGSAVDTQCYIEEQGGCVVNVDCTESIIGGVCDTATGACRYARCSNETGLACATDNDCASGDGICNGGACVYIYDCAYGPGMGSGAMGQYATSTPDAMPTMPLGVQPDGQACTQPTSDAPNNCEGINGCLYYNYYSASGTPIPNSNNSVANCVNTFEGGTGCVYYKYYSPLATPTTPTTKTNCLPRYAEKSKKSPQAGIPDGCFVVDKGTQGKEYNCTAIDGCYYYLDGRVDCTYKEVTATACTTNAECALASTLPLMIPVCNIAAGLCEYQGNGCVYEPNPKGAIVCPGATSPATGGDNFVQCMLNPDSVLPGFLSTSSSGLDSCSVNADCPAGEICLNGTCYPQCQSNVDCESGEQCTTTCATSLDCTGGYVCTAGLCTPPMCANATPWGTLWNVTSTYLGLTTFTDANCRYSTLISDPYTSMAPFSTTGTTSHSEPLSGLSVGSYAYYVLCQELSSSVLSGLCQIDFDIATISCIPGTICPNGAMCPANGICPATVPSCAGAFPTGILPFGTTSATMGLTTAQDAMCSYSLIAIDPYASMAPFANTNSTNHSTDVSGLLIGSNTYYAKCQDTASGAITNACAISFNIGTTCTSSATCAGGFMCIGGTCQPPVCSGATPTGALAPGTPSTTISLTTDADANCRYSANATDTYGAMTPFATTGTVNHSSFVSGLVTGGNTQYVRCQDVVTSAEKFCQIPFSVGVCSQEFKCDTGFMCIPNTGIGICVPLPVCTPGTFCPDGALCPANGVCPPPPCVLGGFACPPTFCPAGTVYNAASGACENCAINSTLPGCGEWMSFCALNPLNPLCVGGGPGGFIAIPSGPTTCNTLGYTFTGTAITPSGNCDLVAIILALLSWMAWVVALLAVLSGLRAAYLYITSMGDEKKLILARRYLIYTTLGVAVAVLTFSIVAITRAILNI